MRMILVSILLGVAAVGCAHSAMRGSVAMKLNDQDAHVCLGENEVKNGDKVNLFRNECGNKSAGKADTSGAGCKKIKIGEGTIMQTLNEHYSVMRVEPGVSFAEGTVVEKQ